MEASLKGFSLLNKYFGSFTITSEMFALTMNHHCKVWVTPEFSLNFPRNHEISWLDNKSQLLTIFKNICLSTILAQEFFETLKSA